MPKMGPRWNVPFRRKLEGRTDYRYRIRLLRSGKPRLVVRPSLKHVTVQVVSAAAKGDAALASAHSRELSKFGWKANTGNVPAAYLTGLLCGYRAKGAGIAESVLDLGKFVPTSQGRIFAVLKGVLDAGVKVPHGEGVLPTDERTCGNHITKPSAGGNVSEHFNQIKQAIVTQHGG